MSTAVPYSTKPLENLLVFYSSYAQLLIFISMFDRRYLKLKATIFFFKITAATSVIQTFLLFVFNMFPKCMNLGRNLAQVLRESRRDKVVIQPWES